jgi:hypothetical protein
MLALAIGVQDCSVGEGFFFISEAKFLVTAELEPPTFHVFSCI